MALVHRDVRADDVDDCSCRGGYSCCMTCDKGQCCGMGHGAVLQLMSCCDCGWEHRYENRMLCCELLGKLSL